VRADERPHVSASRPSTISFLRSDNCHRDNTPRFLINDNNC
jgi:hypothetical protein